ncbi:helix-turn-helix domain-containing protein [Chitinophagaceae bacterium MMS25-I14]
MGDHTTHHGRNVKRLREILGVKQEALAIELGKEWNQQKVSALENKEQIDEDLLERIALALHVPKEKIKNFDDEQMVYNIQNNYEGASNNHNIENYNFQCTFNPFDKLLELMAEIKQLHSEKEALYERMLAEKGK